MLTAIAASINVINEMNIKHTINGNNSTINTSINVLVDSTKGKAVPLCELLAFLRGIPQVNMTIIVQSADKITNSVMDK